MTLSWYFLLSGSSLYLSSQHLNSSNIIQPMPHMSDAMSYWVSQRETSGARYQREPTWFDKLRSFFCRDSFWAISFLETDSCILYWATSWLALDFIILSRILLVFPLPCPIQLSGRVLASPKSQILMQQSVSMRMLEGLISLWMTFAEWMNLIAHKQLYTILLTCSRVIPT